MSHLLSFLGHCAVPIMSTGDCMLPLDLLISLIYHHSWKCPSYGLLIVYCCQLIPYVFILGRSYQEPSALEVRWTPATILSFINPYLLLPDLLLYLLYYHAWTVLSKTLSLGGLMKS